MPFKHLTATPIPKHNMNDKKIVNIWTTGKAALT